LLPSFFFKELPPGGVGLIYFNGLLLRSTGGTGTGLLLPVQFATDGVEAHQEALDVAWLLRLFEAQPNRTGIIVLDGMQQRTGRENHVPMVTLPQGALLAIAAIPLTGEGSSESNATKDPATNYSCGDNTFLQHFLLQLEVPSVHIEEIFKRTRRQVAAATSGRQVPWESSALIADFVPNPCGNAIS